MPMRKKWLLAFTAIVCFASTPVLGQSKVVRVGAVGSPPFVIQGTKLTGIASDIWHEIARMQGLKFEMTTSNNVPETIDAVAQNRLDIAIGPLSITSERLHKVTFTQPFFQADIGLMLPLEKPSLWQRFRPFFEIAFLGSFGGVLILLFLVGNLLWLAERHKNSAHFPPAYLPGVGNGMWFALVTLTTVGYGDCIPVTPMGRLITGIWMILTMITISSITAGMTTALTLSFSNVKTERFTQPTDLKDTRVAVKAGSSSAHWAAIYQARLIRTQTLAEAIRLLENSQVDSVVFDRPLLQYYLRQHPTLSMRVTNFSLARENYGFALPLNSPLLLKVNVALLQLQESGKMKELQDKWLK